MSEEQTKPTEVKQENNSQRPSYEKNRGKLRQKRKRDDRQEENDGFNHKIIEIRRVSRMYKGGRRMRISVFVAVGDGKGKIGLGLGKGDDVRAAQEKAIRKAKKNLVFFPLKGNTIPHEVQSKTGAARVMIKPASPGTGIVAGSSMRMVAEVAGIRDLLGKILGTNNKISNAYATVDALAKLRETRL